MECIDHLICTYWQVSFLPLSILPKHKSILKCWEETLKKKNFCQFLEPIPEKILGRSWMLHFQFTTQHFATGYFSVRPLYKFLSNKFFKKRTDTDVRREGNVVPAVNQVDNGRHLLQLFLRPQETVHDQISDQLQELKRDIYILKWKQMLFQHPKGKQTRS